jgi:hypothetical protein
MIIISFACFVLVNSTLVCLAIAAEVVVIVRAP